MRARIDAKVDTKAGAGLSARESTAATMHRQPTTGSIAAAEERLGELSAQRAEAVGKAMARAHAADSVGDKRACDEALADAQRAIGP